MTMITIKGLDMVWYLICLQYDLSKFCPYNTVLIDHSDPSINTGMLNGMLLIQNWVNEVFGFSHSPIKCVWLSYFIILQLLCSIDSTNWKTWCCSARFCHFSSPMVGCRAYVPASILSSQLYEWIYGPHSWWIWGCSQNLILTTYLIVMCMLFVVDKVIS